uniref:G-protein coupled receptors family 2 profile 1 domain-containing protein n=1 Tax=Xiphophorus couchianus TaxID=32473 RepID=A0A3B5KNY0_9TELE
MGQSEKALSQGQHRCVEPSKRDAQENRTGERQTSNHSETPTTEAMWVRTEKIILENENKCLEKMKNAPPYNKSGLHCSRNWDGWLCWDDTPAGSYASQNCPDYFVNFDQQAKKYCGADGEWFRHPASNKIWTNYTLCVTTDDKRPAVMSIYKRCTDHRFCGQFSFLVVLLIFL